MTAEITPEFSERLQKAYFIWLTTVRTDGMPQPTPVWFVREGDTFLVYSMPDAQKIKNIQANPKVALSFNEDDEGETFIVVMGEASLDSNALPVDQNPPYIAKYQSGMSDLNITPESMTQDYTTAIRIRPTHVRGQ